jgi:hypothetical protein
MKTGASKYKVAVDGPHGSGYGQPITADSDSDAVEQMHKHYAPGITKGMHVLLVGPDGAVVATCLSRP